MLSRLHITNYALIDSVDISFRPGFNVITGETGAGKSIMLGALSLILGGRADTKAVRSHDSKSVIEAVFAVEHNRAARAFCEANDIDWLPEGAILRREISPSGRSRTFVNDTPVTLSQLRDLAIHLIDIHSQHQNLLLADPAFQLTVLDNLAGNASRLETYTARYRQLRDAVRRLKATRESIRKTREDEEFTRYQLDQLESASLQEGELAELESRRELLANLTDVKSRVESALDDLDGSSRGAVSLIGHAQTMLSTLAANLPDGDELLQRLESAVIEVQDIVETLADVNDSLDADPDELDSIEERLNMLYGLQHRHRVASVEELIDLRDSLRGKLESLEDSPDTLATLEKEARRAMALVKETAAELSESRRNAAEQLARQLRDTAAPLGMKNLQVEIKVSPADLSSTGSDHVEFLFSFNKNQPLLPVANTASGGEISRLMLSLKSIIARHMDLPAIIFDEIDTGVSGDVATRMGRMMEEIGQNLQVITITHLPQVAARGATHFHVYKEDDDNATHTRIAPLSEDARIDELTVMLSGCKDDEAARAAARSLLSAAHS